MRALLCISILCAGVVSSAGALADPASDARAQLRIAKQLHERGDAEGALAAVNRGLALAPRDLALLQLRGLLLVELREPAEALAAYEAYIAAGATGRDLRFAQEIVATYAPVRETFLEVTIANGPASVYLDSKTNGTFCFAAPSCSKGVLPRAYKVIVERPGFDRWTEQITIEPRTTTRLAVTLIEKPSLLTVRVAQPGARIAVDDRDYQDAATISAGAHRIVVTLDGYETVRREIRAREGQPVELDLALSPVAPPPAVEAGTPVTEPGTDASGPAMSRNHRIASIALAGGGGIALGVGLYLGQRARATNAEVRALCGDDRVCESQSAFERGRQLVRDARSRATASTVFVAAGGAAIAAGVILWLIAPRERRSQTARIVPSVSGTRDIGIAVIGSF